MVAFILIGPSQTKVSGPTFTTGFFTIVKIKESVVVVLQGLFPAALKVKVTEPFAISFEPGMYFGVSEFGSTIVPSPVPFVQRRVALFMFWTVAELAGTI